MVTLPIHAPQPDSGAETQSLFNTCGTPRVFGLVSPHDSGAEIRLRSEPADSEQKREACRHQEWRSAMERRPSSSQCSEEFPGVSIATGEPSRSPNAGPQPVFPTTRSDSNQNHNLVFHDGKTTSASHPFVAFLGKEFEVPLGDGTSLRHGPVAAPSIGSTNPPHPGAVSRLNHGEPYLRADLASHDNHQGSHLLSNGKATASNEPSNVHQSQQAQCLCNHILKDLGSPVVSSKAGEINRLAQAETPVPSIATDEPPSVGAMGAAGQHFKENRASRLWSAMVAGLLQFGSIFLTTSSSPVLAKLLPLSGIDAGSQHPECNDPSSSLTRSSTPVPNAGKWPSESDNEETIADDCSTPREECELPEGELPEGELPEHEQPERGHGHAMTPSYQAYSPTAIFFGRNWHWEVMDERAKNRQPFFKIAEILCEDLDDDETRDGFIYAFRTQEPNGIGRRYTRIGADRNDDVRSLMKVRQDCYGECTVVYPPPGEWGGRVKHAERVRRLIHAELVTRGATLKTCPTHQKCKLQHQAEWFDVEAQHAVRVIQKWTQWAENSRYDTMGVAGKRQRRDSLNLSIGAESLETGFSSTPGPSLPPEPSERIGLKVLDKNTLLGLCWPLDSSPTESRHDPSKSNDGAGAACYPMPFKKSFRSIRVCLPAASAYQSYSTCSATPKAEYDQDWGGELTRSLASQYNIKFPSTRPE